MHTDLMLVKLSRNSQTIPHLESAVMLKLHKDLRLLCLAKESKRTAVHSSQKLQRTTDLLTDSIKTACSPTATGCRTMMTGCRATMTGYSNIAKACNNCRKGPGDSGVSPLLIAAQMVKLSRG